MARKRNGWVPVGEASGNLDGPVKAIHGKASPQALPPLHPSGSGGPACQRPAKRDADLGFMARLTALCSAYPESIPATGENTSPASTALTRLYMQAVGRKLNCPLVISPDLLLAWVCTEVGADPKPRTGSWFVRWPSSCKQLGILSSDSGGSRAVIRTRVRNQMKRLFSASVRLIYEDEHMAKQV